jgi:hypothetical protein
VNPPDLQTIVFPDVEALLVTYLNGILDVPVFTRIPNPRPPSFVRVLRTGGPKQGLVTDEAQITVEAWHNDSVQASNLAQQARAHLNVLAGQMLSSHQIHRVREMSGPGNLPDPTSGQARYTWTLLVDIRGHAI